MDKRCVRRIDLCHWSVACKGAELQMIAASQFSQVSVSITPLAKTHLDNPVFDLLHLALSRLLPIIGDFFRQLICQLLQTSSSLLKP